MFSPIREIDIYGVFMPPLLLWATLSLLLLRVAHHALERRGFYHSDIQQQIFDASLFVIMTGLFSLFIH